MGRAIRIGRVFGIELKLDYSWFIIFFLVTWSLADHYFPMAYPGWPVGTYWWMGVATSLLFFASVVTHELAHSLVSQSFGVPVRDITLFVFGGAAHISEEPRRARDEFLMALAGPATSIALGGLFGLVWSATQTTGGPLHALTGWLATINVTLGIFNLIPGFPLDGGRVLRAVIWKLTGDLRQATRVATGFGQLIAYGFIFWGVLQIFNGNWANGLWIAFIGWFLENAAVQSQRQLIVQQMLAGHSVREVMTTDSPTIPRHLTLDVLVDQIVLPTGRRCLPVVEHDELHGLLTLERIRNVPREQWPTTRVGDVMIPLSELKIARPDDELPTIFERMVDEDINQFPVMDDGRFRGIVAREHVLSFLRTREEVGLA